MKKSTAFERWNNYMREQNEKAGKDHEEKLLLCPFCGGEAEYRVGNRYATQCHYIQCRKCKAQTGIIDERTYLMFGGKSNVNFTADTAKQAVFESWNRRAQCEQSQVVHGRWIEVAKMAGVAVLKCSVCGKEHPMLPSAFCRDCGAKMEGGQKQC